MNIEGNTYEGGDMMKYSVALKVVAINNVFNDLNKLLYTAYDKDNQSYEFITEARIPMYNYIAIEFTYYTVVKGVIRPIGYSIYPLNVKNNKLYLYSSLYKSKNSPKIN